MLLAELKNNPTNPRIIKDDKFKKLVQSLQDLPKMMELRPIVVDENNIVQGGNMRLKALQELKYKEIPDICSSSKAHIATLNDIIFIHNNRPKFHHLW